MDQQIFFVLIISLPQFSIEREDDFAFEKSVAYILNKEINETSNKFIILYHPLDEKDQNLNKLMKELNREGSALVTHSQSMGRKL